MRLKPEPLTQAAFAPFGDVVDIAGVTPLIINQGFARRFDDLCGVEVGEGAAKVSIFVAEPRPVPIAIALMERHPLGSQMFYPLQDQAWLVVVCGDPQDGTTYRAFLASGQQGVNYRRNQWHHPLLVLGGAQRFMVVDRKGAGQNLEEVVLERPLVLVAQ